MPEYIYYKIVSKDNNIKDCYVGKTTNFKRRIIEHKSICNNVNLKNYNLKIYKFIRENGGINNWEFIEIEKSEYDDKNSAFKERELIEELNANLNIIIPSRTKKEYYENNKEYFKENNKEYNNNNKDKAKEYRKNNKEVLNQKSRIRNKIYYE